MNKMKIRTVSLVVEEWPKLRQKDGAVLPMDKRDFLGSAEADEQRRSVTG
jgi:hypothetical protein